jgi:hypothetical protein
MEDWDIEMKVRQKKRFVIELDDAELNQFYDWLVKLIAPHPHTRDPCSRPKVVDDLRNALYAYRHGI